MLRNVSIKYYSSGLIIKQRDIRGMVCVPNILKHSFYEQLLTASINHTDFDYTDLEGDNITLHMDYKKHFNTFINGQFIGDLPYILLNEYSVAIPVETDNSFDYFEVYDSRLMECYLLEKEEILK